MPRIPEKDRAALPKPTVHPGVLGFYPLNAFSLSCIAQEMGDRILDYTSPLQTEMPQTKSSYKIVAGKKSTKLDLNDIYYPSFTQALYRGKLPQVVLSMPKANGLPGFMKNVLDYIDTMLTLGFIREPKDVDTVMPVMVMVTNGVFFSQFIAKLTHQLNLFENITNEHIEAITNRFVRGNFTNWHAEDLTLCEPQPIMAVPNRIKIAGGSQQNRELVQSVLSLNGIITVVENRVSNASARLELESAISRIINVMLPRFESAKLVKPALVKKMEKSILSSVLSLGYKTEAFDVSEGAMDIGASFAATSKTKSLDAIPALQPEDQLVLMGLNHVAAQHGTDADKDLFRSLTQKLGSAFEA